MAVTTRLFNQMSRLQNVTIFSNILINFILRAQPRRALVRKKDYTPVTWDKYFEEKHDVDVGDGDVSFEEILFIFIIFIEFLKDYI